MDSKGGGDLIGFNETVSRRQSDWYTLYALLSNLPTTGSQNGKWPVRCRGYLKDGVLKEPAAYEGGRS